LEPALDRSLGMNMKAIRQKVPFIGYTDRITDVFTVIDAASGRMIRSSNVAAMSEEPSSAAREKNQDRTELTSDIGYRKIAEYQVAEVERRAGSLAGAQDQAQEVCADLFRRGERIHHQ
jgi:predicted Ser/Thr protein kinase